MNRDQHEAYIRRVMWISFEERLKSVFSEMDSRGADASTIGLLYFSSCHLNDPKYKVKNIYRSNSPPTISARVTSKPKQFNRIKVTISHLIMFFNSVNRLL